MNTQQDYIAVFDSGVGGLSVLRHLCRLMPGERYVYFGDSANAPYGSRPTEQVLELTLDAVQQLHQRYRLKALVIACNTATAAAITQLRQRYPQQIIVGIEPALKLARDRFPTGRIGVMATEVTLREQKFDSLMHRFAGGTPVLKIPAPGLVELVEQGKAASQEALDLLRPILAPYVGQLDALVLGCTHYPFAAGAIRQILGPEVALLEGGEGTALETRRRLIQADLLENGPGDIILTNSAPDPRLIRLSWDLLRAGR